MEGRRRVVRYNERKGKETEAGSVRTVTAVRDIRE